MAEFDGHPAAANLRSFFAAMKAWGDEMIRHHRSIDWDHADEQELDRNKVEQRARLASIYASFCESGPKARRLRDEGLAFHGDSPEYDPEFQPIVAIEERDGRVVIETKQTNKFGWRYRYELVEVGGSWRIRDNKKRGSDKNPAWEPDLL